jgi:DNA-binding PadR family transcriptional regulator
MIELAILGLLGEQDLHGYELKKQLAELLGPWSSVSFGSLYPALARLEKAGRVKAVEAHTLGEPSTPMTGALSGELAAFKSKLVAKAPANRRGKKVYGLTELGRERFHDLLTAEGPDDERTFAVRVAFCTQLEPAERIALFERRRAELVGQLAARRKPARAGRPTSGPDTRVDPYRRSLRERDTRTLNHDLAWLDELIAATVEAAAVPAEHADHADHADPTDHDRRGAAGPVIDPAVHAPTAALHPVPHPSPVAPPAPEPSKAGTKP